jgi:hypothetical protein
LGPQWKVRDSVAFAFAKGFYESLIRGETLGQAAREGRQSARNSAPTDPGWLAYVVYGHPNAHVLFGEAAESSTGSAQQKTPQGAELRNLELTSPKAATPKTVLHGRSAETPPLLKPSAASSLNLRIRRPFSDQEKDQFIEETFQSIRAFFERSLPEAERQNPGITTKCQVIDAYHFMAKIYRPKERAISCHIWRDLSRGGSAICYLEGDSWSSNSYNEQLSLEEDGYSLSFRPLMNMGSVHRLGQDAAAEYLLEKLLTWLR